MTWCWIIDDLSTVFTVWAWDYWGSDRVNERTGGQLAPKICKFLLLLYNQMLWCNCELEQRSVSQKLLPKSCKSKLVPKAWKSTSLKTRTKMRFWKDLKASEPFDELVITVNWSPQSTGPPRRLVPSVKCPLQSTGPHQSTGLFSQLVAASQLVPPVNWTPSQTIFPGN